MNIQDIDFEWFIENLEILYEKYGDSYIVIKNKTVIGVYKTFHEGVIAAQKVENPGTYIVQKCAKKVEDLYEYIYTPFFDY